MITTINSANLILSHENWVGLMPFLIMLAGAMGSMLLGTFQFGHGPMRKLPLFLFSALFVAAAGAWCATHISHEAMSLFGGMMQVDYFSSLFTMMLCGATLLVMMGCFSYLEKEHIHFSEFYPIIIVSTLGMMLLSAVTELLCIFIALELMSLAVYVLVGMRRKDALSNEASVKYFIMGGVAAAIFLYGTSLIYGALNTTKLVDIAAAIARDPSQLHNPILLAGLVFVTVAFLFKVAVVPFHMWTPDVYEGAPTLVTSYMATALKAAVFAAFIRIASAFYGDHGVSRMGGETVLLHDIIWILALLTMVLGNFVALAQKNLKRLLAYSAIAHTGYLLVGILAGPKVGYSTLVFYLVAYIAMNLGAFGVLALLSSKEDRNLTVDSMAGLGNRKPWTAAALTIFLLSLGGMPPTAGFVAKYYIFSAAIEAGETTLVLLGVLTSAVAVFYYLRIVVNMYMKEASAETEETMVTNSAFAFASILVCVLLTIHLGLFPAQLLHAMKHIALF